MLLERVRCFQHKVVTYVCLSRSRIHSPRSVQAAFTHAGFAVMPPCEHANMTPLTMALCIMQNAMPEDYIEIIHDIKAARNEVQEVHPCLQLHPAVCLLVWQYLPAWLYLPIPCLCISSFITMLYKATHVLFQPCDNALNACVAYERVSD